MKSFGGLEGEISMIRAIKTVQDVFAWFEGKENGERWKVRIEWEIFTEEDKTKIGGTPLALTRTGRLIVPHMEKENGFLYYGTEDGKPLTRFN